MASALPLALGHGFMTEPASRNKVANIAMKEFCPHCLQSGGPPTVSSRAGGLWPSKDAPESHGLCGDPVQGAAVETKWRSETYLVPTPVQKSYTGGEVAEFDVEVRAHHSGHFEFRICETGLDGKSLASRAAGQECLNTWLLERAPPLNTCTANDAEPDCQPLDTDHPERWYLPPSKGGTEKYKMRYVIPADLTCTQCTMQWYWSTGNTCLYDSGYITYFEKMEAAGWPAQQWCSFCSEGVGATCGGGQYAEEFWNCADIEVRPGGAGTLLPQTTTQMTESSVMSTTTQVASTAAPPPSTAAPQPEPSPAPEPSPQPEGCAALWGKCAGEGWTGPTCCESGNYCKYQDKWYSQCIPGSKPVLSEMTALRLRRHKAHSTLHSSSGAALLELSSQVSRGEMLDDDFGVEPEPQLSTARIAEEEL